MVILCCYQLWYVSKHFTNIIASLFTVFSSPLNYVLYFTKPLEVLQLRNAKVLNHVLLKNVNLIKSYNIQTGNKKKVRYV